jgi:hypothetical protein
MTLSDRDVVFISHATPDDNEFVRWLGTRLTGYGYKVWADIFDLAGGTPFWVSIEDAIGKFSGRGVRPDTPATRWKSTEASLRAGKIHR